MNRRSLRSTTKTQMFVWGLDSGPAHHCRLMVLNIIPLINTINQSFHKTGDFGGNIFIGLKNYQSCSQTEAVLQSIINTLKYTIVQVPFSVFIALVLAVMLNRQVKGRGAYRTIFFLPMVVAPAAISMVWRWLYHTEFGLINNLFNLKISWISDPSIAVFSIAIIGIWSDIGYNMILFLARCRRSPRIIMRRQAWMGRMSSKLSAWHHSDDLPDSLLCHRTRMIAAMQVFDTIFMVMGHGRIQPCIKQSLVYLFYQSPLWSRFWVWLNDCSCFVGSHHVHNCNTDDRQKEWVHYN